MLRINERQVWDLFISGYTIKEIAKLNSCSESTIKRKIKKIKERKRNNEELDIAKTFYTDDCYISKTDKVNKNNRTYNKNEIIQMYLDGYQVKEISIKKNFDYYDVKNILRNFRRAVGYEVFKKSYEKIHKSNRESLKEKRKEEIYKSEILKTTGMDVRSIISPKSLLKVTQSQYDLRSKAYILTKEAKEIATWDLPKRIDRKIL